MLSKVELVSNQEDRALTYGHVPTHLNALKGEAVFQEPVTPSWEKFTPMIASPILEEHAFDSHYLGATDGRGRLGDGSSSSSSSFSSSPSPSTASSKSSPSTPSPVVSSACHFFVFAC